MLKVNKNKYYTLSILICFLTLKLSAQQSVSINDTTTQHFFTYSQIEVLPDKEGNLKFNEILKPSIQQKFKPSTGSTPHTDKNLQTFWFKIKIKHNESINTKFLLEFFDQTIDRIDVYAPLENGGYAHRVLGDRLDFNKREIDHKNFALYLENYGHDVKTYYFRVHSEQISYAIIVLRSVNWFISYALHEYLYFGIFYGMILVFSFYNVLMFIAMRQRQYLHYVMYILSVAIFEMSSDGIAFQFLWPKATNWNQIAYAFALCGISIFSLLFSRDFLHVKRISVKLDRIILSVVYIRIAFLLISIYFFPVLLTYKFLDFIPLAVAFYSGLYILKKGYTPARFFVVGYSFLFVGFMIKLMITLFFQELNQQPIGYYSLSICFVIEMIFLSFAIGDKVRILRRKKEDAQTEIMHQMAENAALKDSLNKDLEQKVSERTKEVFQKSIIIEAKNKELTLVNNQLKIQSEEIERMNILLEQDNRELLVNVEKITRDRVMSTDVDFEEFSKIYPNKDKCNDFLEELKWKNGYTCKKCKNQQYYSGAIPLSRRCTKCSYTESVTSYTIFHNTRIPINKAFYMVFLVYTSKGKISSHKLSQLLNMRQSTCWTFSTKIKTVMEERKAKLKKSGKSGWSELVLD